MNFTLSEPRYISLITHAEGAEGEERIAANAGVAAPYDLIASGKGSIKCGSVVFHRLPHEREPNAQFAYLEPQPDSEHTEAGTFHIDIPVEPELFDRWLASGILQQRLSIAVSFGFTPPPGLKYSAGPEGWQSQTWFVETHRVLVAKEVTLMMQSALPRPPNGQAAAGRVA